MSAALRNAVDRLSRVPRVRGAVIVDAVAGVPVAAELSPEAAGPALPALAASLFACAARTGESAGFGQLRTLQLEAERGHVVLAPAGELVVAALADQAAQLGMVRLETRRAAEEIG